MPSVHGDAPTIYTGVLQAEADAAAPRARGSARWRSWGRQGVGPRIAGRKEFLQAWLHPGEAFLVGFIDAHSILSSIHSVHEQVYVCLCFKSNF